MWSSFSISSAPSPLAVNPPSPDSVDPPIDLRNSTSSPSLCELVGAKNREADQVARALQNVLKEGVTVTPSRDLKRRFAQKRPYNSQKRNKAAPRPIASPQKFRDFGAIAEGSCFTKANGQGGAPCCQDKCNSRFTQAEMEQQRKSVPVKGLGQQEARKIFVRSRIASSRKLVLLDSNEIGSFVCWKYFVAVTGCSRNLIDSALKLGGTGMKKRNTVNSKGLTVTSFMNELSSRWEQQPDSQEIHMAIPTKLFVWQMFVKSSACVALGYEDCSYSYFVQMWQKHFGHVKLKKSMRFTKCDTCTLASEEEKEEEEEPVQQQQQQGQGRGAGGGGGVAGDSETLQPAPAASHPTVRMTAAAYRPRRVGR